MKKIGHYQKVIMRGIEREGSQSYSIKRGYSRQVKSLLKRRLIRKKNNRLYLTIKGKQRL